MWPPPPLVWFSCVSGFLQIPLFFLLAKLYWGMERRLPWIDWLWYHIYVIWWIPFLALGPTGWLIWNQDPLWLWMVFTMSLPIEFSLFLALFSAGAV